MQPFAFPFRHWAWTCELLLGESFEECPGLEAVEFEHDEQFGKEIKELVESKREIFLHDPVADLALLVKEATAIPLAIAKSVIADLCTDAGGLPNEAADEVLFAVQNALAPVVFSEATTSLISHDLQEEFSNRWAEEKEPFEAMVREGMEALLVRNRCGS
jgi:hypothetical protein